MSAEREVNNDQQNEMAERKRRTSILKTTVAANGAGSDDTVTAELNPMMRRVSFNQMPKVQVFEKPSSNYSESGKSTPFGAEGSTQFSTTAASPLPSGFMDGTRAVFQNQDQAFKPGPSASSSMVPNTPAPSPLPSEFFNQTRAVFGALKPIHSSTPAAPSPLPSAFFNETNAVFGHLKQPIFPQTFGPQQSTSPNTPTATNATFESISPACRAFGSPTLNMEHTDETMSSTRSVENVSAQNLQQRREDAEDQLRTMGSPPLTLDMTNTSSQQSRQLDAVEDRQGQQQQEEEEEEIDQVAKYGSIDDPNRTQVIQHTPYLARILRNTQNDGSGSKVLMLDDLTHQHNVIGGASLLFSSQDEFPQSEPKDVSEMDHSNNSVGVSHQITSSPRRPPPQQELSEQSIPQSEHNETSEMDQSANAMDTSVSTQPTQLPMPHLDDTQFKVWHDAEMDNAEKAYLDVMERREAVYKRYYEAEMRKLDSMQGALEHINRFRDELREAEKKKKDELNRLLNL